ncbi:hypothetical protein QZM15_16415 [Burkholderia sp. AU44665]|uniref:hypothetical protein n=1 Tax=Burkholderia sp. AU44665 TaxID=3059203 RepID=UPI00265F9D09|nr:hypothetical protein [Burkholderia sp. AU44665]MDN7700055.1 hypothetical protein [Burkholderia sp. AU44665]
MKVLLVYQNVPESVDWLVVPNPSAEDLEILNAAHGSFTNSCNTDDATEAALDKISYFLCDPHQKDLYATDYLHKAGADFGKWYRFKIDEAELPNTAGIDKVFTCGFLM